MRLDGANPALEIEGAETINAKCLLIATGAEYRQLDVPGCQAFEGRGVLAAGDVRSGSVKRVASTVGEGAMAVQFVHEFFKEM